MKKPEQTARSQLLAPVIARERHGEDTGLAPLHGRGPSTDGTGYARLPTPEGRRGCALWTGLSGGMTGYLLLISCCVLSTPDSVWTGPRNLPRPPWSIMPKNSSTRSHTASQPSWTSAGPSIVSNLNMCFGASTNTGPTHT